MKKEGEGDERQACNLQSGGKQEATTPELAPKDRLS